MKKIREVLNSMDVISLMLLSKIVNEIKDEIDWQLNEIADQMEEINDKY